MLGVPTKTRLESSLKVLGVPTKTRLESSINKFNPILRMIDFSAVTITRETTTAAVVAVWAPGGVTGFKAHGLHLNLLQSEVSNYVM